MSNRNGGKDAEPDKTENDSPVPENRADRTPETDEDAGTRGSGADEDAGTRGSGADVDAGTAGTAASDDSESQGSEADEVPEELRSDDEVPPSGLVTDRMPPTAGGTLWLVSHREMTATLKNKAFVISTVVMVLAVLGALIGGHVYASSGNETPTVAMTGVKKKQVPQAEQQLGMQIKPAKNSKKAKQMVLDDSVDAAIDTDKQTGQPMIIAKSDEPEAVSDAIDKALTQGGEPDIKYLQPKAHSDYKINSLGVGLTAGLLIIVFVLAASVVQTVVDERRNRANEVLLSVARAKSLMSGKVIGRGVLALAQAVLLSAIVLLALSIIGPASLTTSTAIVLGWTMLLFAGALALFAGMFAAAATASTHGKRIVSITIMVLLLVVPLTAAAIYRNNELITEGLSYLPLSSPVVMPVRLYTGGVDWWEPLAAVGGMIVAVWIVLAICGSIYKRATGKALNATSR